MGLEFAKDTGKTAVIVRALYGCLKLAGASFISHLARCIEFLRYESCRADPDLWLKSEIRPEDEVHYYSYLQCYVDDILGIHHNADTVLQQIQKCFPLKPGLDKLEMSLSSKLCKSRLHNGVWPCVMSPVKYVQETIRDCAAHLAANYGGRFRLP